VDVKNSDRSSSCSERGIYLIPWARDLSIFLVRWNGESIPEILAHVFIGRAPQFRTVIAFIASVFD